MTQGGSQGIRAKAALITIGMRISLMLLIRLMREKLETRSVASKRLPMPR